MSRPHAPSWRKPSRLHWLKGFAADDSAATMLEFVLTLPVVIVIFVGIVQLSKISAESVHIWSSAHVNTFDKLTRTQTLELGEIIAENESGRDERPRSLLLPATAGAYAMEQLIEYPPAISNRYMRAPVTVLEGSVYGFSLPASGHWGEAQSRAELLQIAGKRVSPVHDAVTSDSSRLFGVPRGGSMLARSLVYDGPSLTSFGAAGDCAGNDMSLTDMAVSGANGVLSETGLRATLAGSMQYGTLTGKSNSRAVRYGPIVVEPMAYLNVGVSPHTLKDAWMQPLFTMFVTRLALEDCSLQPYSGLLGIGTNRKGEYGLPTQVNDLALDKVPTPKDAGIAYPLNYE